MKPLDAAYDEVASYDPRQDFAFAKKSGDVGLVVWNSPLSNHNKPTASSISIPASWGVARRDRRLRLPMGVNIGLGSPDDPTWPTAIPRDMTPNTDQYLGGQMVARGRSIFGIGGTVAWGSDALRRSVALRGLISRLVFAGLRGPRTR